jgi:hypothetical protein
MRLERTLVSNARRPPGRKRSAGLFDVLAKHGTNQHTRWTLVFSEVAGFFERRRRWCVFCV